MSTVQCEMSGKTESPLQFKLRIELGVQGSVQIPTYFKHKQTVYVDLLPDI